MRHRIADIVVDICVCQVIVVPSYIYFVPIILAACIKNVGQVVAFHERRITDARYAIRYRHACQAVAAAERRLTDARYAAVRGNNACIAAEDQCFAFFFNYAIAFSAIYGVSFINRNAFQPVAKSECTGFEIRNTGGNRDACEFGAVRERIIVDALNAVTQGHT